MITSVAPVLVLRYNILFQVFPPSFVLYTPRSSLSLHKAPKTPIYISSVLFGFMVMEAMRSDFSKPIFVQLLPPSVVLYNPSPIETEFRVQISPVPTQITLSGSLGSTAIAPIDWVCLSKIGLKVAPPLLVFHTPPPAVPA